MSSHQNQDIHEESRRTVPRIVSDNPNIRETENERRLRIRRQGEQQITGLFNRVLAWRKHKNERGE